MKDIYQECPLYKNNHITLRQTHISDAPELLNCYSDKKAVPFFNSDNCHGDDFYYDTLEKMNKAVEFWEFSYQKRYFVRWTVILNETNEKIGTIEMFHRIADDEFNHYGVLRVDLQSSYETQQVLDSILQIVKGNFYVVFSVNSILTKAIPAASERIKALLDNGFKPLNKKLMVYDDYYISDK
jgi:hypothetical protein